MDDSDKIDELITSSQVAEYLREKGMNIIPIIPGTKIPPKGFKLEQYFDKKCDHKITDNDSIAILHGNISNTFAVDVDLKNGGGWEDAVHILARDVEKILSNTLVIKTPKQGCHFICRPEGAIFPPKNAKYFNKDGVEIDIKTQGGYTLLPPSIHPEKQLGRYQFISSTLEPEITDWKKLEAHLASKGFFLERDIKDNNLKSDYDLDTLLRGKFQRGTRRKSLNSLYIKLRIRRWGEKHALAKIQEINRKLDESLSDKEIEYNTKYAESFFKYQVKPSLEEKQQTKKTQKNFTPYNAAAQLMDEFVFVSHVSGEIYYYAKGVYRKNGKLLISKKCRQYWEPLEIDTTFINETINIIKDKTMILIDDEDQEIFDTDYKKIILKNGMFDFDELKFKEWDSSVLSTIKHPIFYDETKSCPKFEKFLDSCFEGDEKRITQVWEMMALSLIKKYIIQKGYVNYGIGSNGKSTFLAILRNMLGINNTTSIPMQQFQKSQFIGYELRGKCANISADGGTEQITKTGYIKSVLGGDAIRCEQKFRDPFDFLPFVTLIFTFNELPVITDASDGFARKIQLIHWDQRFYGDQRDANVDRIAFDSDERSGIFNKLIPVIDRLLNSRRLKHESSVDDTKATWLSRSDSFYRFKNEHIVIGVNHKISPSLLESAYEQFCDEERMTPLPKNLIFDQLKSISGQSPSVTRVDGKSVRMWMGFTISSQLKDEKQKDLKDE